MKMIMMSVLVCLFPCVYEGLCVLACLMYFICMFVVCLMLDVDLYECVRGQRVGVGVGVGVDVGVGACL